MALSDRAIISLAEFKNENFIEVGDTAQDTRLEMSIERVSAAVEAYLDRVVISQGTLTEYYTIPRKNSTFQLNQWPIVSVTTVHEDDTRTYAAASLLTVDTEYLVVVENGELVRTWSATQGRRFWSSHFRAVKVVYVAGWKRSDTTGAADNVPWEIRDVVMRASARLWKEVERSKQGVVTMSDAAGSWTRYSDRILTDEMRSQINQHRRFGFGSGKLGRA